MTMRANLILIFISLIITFMQSVINTSCSFYMLDLLFVFIFLSTLVKKSEFSVVLVFFLGLIIDLLSYNYLGYSSIKYLLLHNFILFFILRLKIINNVSVNILLLSSCFYYCLVSAVIEMVFYGVFSPVNYLNLFIFTTPLTVICYYGLNFLLGSNNIRSFL